MDDLPTAPASLRHRPAASSGVASGPPPASLRRASTASAVVDDARRSSRASSSSHMFGANGPFSPTDASSSPSFEAPPRRSSNFSEISLNEARDILNPQPAGRGVTPATEEESSSLASLSLAFAIMPALAGVMFTNGSAVVTDIMLLGLAGVFLHWSVTQPWVWYHSAQEVRVHHEECLDMAIEDDSDVDSATPAPMHRSPLGNVPEEEEEASPESEPEAKADRSRPSARQQAALAELYAYEIVSLLSCFLLPLMGAYLLHTIRSQLSRPSEGLVSNYNLTIFLLASELRVFSHMIKLVQSRTLHLQRVVRENPDGSRRTTHSAEQMEAVLARLERLEVRLAEGGAAVQGGKQEAGRPAQDAVVAREVRNAIQPDLDALNRAVRRYEKKATLLQFQTESRFAGMDARLDDAIALAASAAKNSATTRTSVLGWVMDSLTAMIRLPFKALLQILLLPLSTLLALTSSNKDKKKGAPTKMSRSSSSSSRSGGKAGGMQARYSGDRVPTRVSKR